MVLNRTELSPDFLQLVENFARARVKRAEDSSGVKAKKRRGGASASALDGTVLHPDPSVAALRGVRKPERELTYAEKQALSGNERYQVLKKFFDEEFNWIGPVLYLTDENIQNEDAVWAVAANLMGMVGELYSIADEVINEEAPGFDSHNLDHIRRDLIILADLFNLAAENSSVQIFLIDYLESILTVILHDIAQGIIGRIKHEIAGSHLVLAIVRVISDDLELQNLPGRVSNNVGTHSTSQWDYEVEAEREGQEAAQGMAVIADEFDITKDRITPEGTALYEQGVVDPWHIIDRHMIGQTRTWDKENRQFKVTFFTDIGSDAATTRYQSHLRHRTKGEAPSAPLDPDFATPEMLTNQLTEEYINFFLQKFLTPDKYNLFKNICRKMYGPLSKDFSVQIKDTNGNVIFDYESNKSSKVPSPVTN